MFQKLYNFFLKLCAIIPTRLGGNHQEIVERKLPLLDVGGFSRLWTIRGTSWHHPRSRSVTPTQLTRVHTFTGGRLWHDRMDLLAKEPHLVPLDANAFFWFWRKGKCFPDSWKPTTKGESRRIAFDGQVFDVAGGTKAVIVIYWTDGIGWDYTTEVLSYEYQFTSETAVVEI